MNIEASLPEVGARCRDEWRDVAADLRRIDAMWTEALAQSGGPFLFGAFSVVDAYFAPVCSRIRTYALAAGRRRVGLRRTHPRRPGDAGLVPGERAGRARLHRGRRALSPARIAPGNSARSQPQRKRADRSPLVIRAPARTGARRSQTWHLRRRDDEAHRAQAGEHQRVGFGLRHGA